MVIDFEVFAPGERLFLFFLVGHVGYLLHYVKKFSRCETTLSPVDYYFRNHFKDTLAAYTTFIGALLALLFVPSDGSFASGVERISDSRSRRGIIPQSFS